MIDFKNLPQQPKPASPVVPKYHENEKWKAQ